MFAVWWDDGEQRKSCRVLPTVTLLIDFCWYTQSNNDVEVFSPVLLDFGSQLILYNIHNLKTTFFMGFVHTSSHIRVETSTNVDDVIFVHRHAIKEHLSLFLQQIDVGGELLQLQDRETP